MTRALWLLAAALPLAAQPKLLLNAQIDTRSAAAGLEREFQTLLAAQPQPAWIGYSVPAVHTFSMGCDFVRDGNTSSGVVHLEPPDSVIVLFRVEDGALNRIRAVSPHCEIDAGGLPVHWLNDVPPAQSVALLTSFAADREHAGDGALNALAMHSDPSAERALDHFLAPDQPQPLRLRAVSALGRKSGANIVSALSALAETDRDTAVKRRALSALQSMPKGEGVPVLIQIAKTHRDPDLRKQAMTSLQHTRDPRALAFFEEILKK